MPYLRPEPLNTDALVAAPAWGCSCPLHRRRLFAGALVAAAASPVLGREGVDVGPMSSMTRWVSADQVEQAAVQNYRRMRQDAANQRALAPDDHPQLIRLRYIAKRIIPYTYEWNPRARSWKWEVSLIGSKQLNAFCMPGGKIAFYYGILTQLQLTDDEVAMIMGHEAAHALREHARERMGKEMFTRGTVSVVSQLFGLGAVGQMAAGGVANLVTLEFSREDESEADLVGIELAARAGYDPGACVTLWQKMARASKGAPPQFLSTHPSGPTRIRDIQVNLPKVEPLYARASRPERRFAVARWNTPADRPTIDSERSVPN